MFGTKVEEMPPNMTEALAGPALVTAAFVLIALHFMPLGPLAPDGPQKVWGNRTFLNMMEQSNLFLSALWLHAIWVSPDVAMQLGAIYLCLRALYPVVWAVWGGPNPSSYTWLLFGTKFNIFYVTFPQARAPSRGLSMHAAARASSPAQPTRVPGHSTASSFTWRWRPSSSSAWPLTSTRSSWRASLLTRQPQPSEHVGVHGMTCRNEGAAARP